MNKKILTAICGAPDHPLKIGEIELPCYVLEDEKRVFVHIGMLKALGMSPGTGSRSLLVGDRLVKFIEGKRIKPYITNDLALMINNPIKFKPTSGRIAHGYEAEILPKICFAVLDAEKAGILQKQQQHIADQARILIKGFAIVGINALIDEVTGYQEIREKRALSRILEKYISKELQAWTKTFPDEFYREMFRLKSWSFDPNTIKRPSVIGRYTNDIVYERLAPAVLSELQKRNPVTEKGHRKQRHHQWLTGDIGHPKLKAHISGILALMRASANWRKFYHLVQISYPKLNEQIPLALDVGDE